MGISFKRWLVLLVLGALAAGLLSACGLFGPAATPTPEPTPAPPTPTPEPLAARVNGEGILLSEYNDELLRVQDAAAEQGASLTAEELKQKTLDELVLEVLLAQQATAGGFSVSDADVQARIDSLVSQLGSPQALSDWLARNHFTEDAFRARLKRQLLALHQRDTVLAGVPETMEQVRAFQILVLDEATANEVVRRLDAGSDFATLVSIYDNSPTGGDLGWFPRGYLYKKEVEDAAFALQPGQHSPVIKTDYGYHVLLVTERDPNRPLSPAARRAFQETALKDWIEQQRSQAVIEILIP